MMMNTNSKVARNGQGPSKMILWSCESCRPRRTWALQVGSKGDIIFNVAPKGRKAKHCYCGDKMCLSDDLLFFTKKTS
jgi:hypothetical protein